MRFGHVYAGGAFPTCAASVAGSVLGRLFANAQHAASHSTGSPCAAELGFLGRHTVSIGGADLRHAVRRDGAQVALT